MKHILSYIIVACAWIVIGVFAVKRGQVMDAKMTAQQQSLARVTQLIVFTVIAIVAAMFIFVKNGWPAEEIMLLLCTCAIYFVMAVHDLRKRKRRGDF